MRNVGFPEPDVRFMNEVRYYRNGIKYYGKMLDMDYAEKVKDFLESIHLKLEKMLGR